MVSEGPSYIVVNNEAGTAVVDAAADLVNYMTARSAPEAAAPLTAALEALKAAKTEQGPYVTIAEHAAALLKSPPAEFEAVLNLLWLVLSAAPSFDEVAGVAVAKLTNPLPSVVAQQVALQAVLVSLFNILPSTSSEKPKVFAKIIELAGTAKTLDQFVPQLPQLAEWLREWQISVDVKHAIVLAIANGLKTKAPTGVLVPEISKHSVALREFLVAVLQNDPEFSAAAKILVGEVLSDSNGDTDQALYHYGVLPRGVLALDGVQKLRGNSDDYFEALAAVGDGDYAAFSSLANKEVAENPLFVKHARIAAFSRLASATSAKELGYAQIAEAAGLPNAVEAVEPLIVEAGKAGLVEGRMNQLQQKFVVTSATVVGPLTNHHWDTIETRLQAWQRSLKAVLDVSSKARNNYDLVKSLNKLEVN